MRESRRFHAENYDLHRRILNFLHACRVPGLPSLELEVDGGRVIMRGELPSLREKQWCLQFIRHIGGVASVIDEAQVSDGLDPAG